MMKAVDTAIVGGGVIGLTLAYLLAQSGQRVTVLERGELGREASWAGAGILPAGNPRRAKSPLGQLRARGVALYPAFSRELKERTGIDNGYWQCGGLELRRSPDELDKKRLDLVAQAERGEGIVCEVVDGPRLREIAPALAPDLPGAVYFPGVAQVRNPWHLRALTAACQQVGVDLCSETPVTSISGTSGRITHIVTPRGVLSPSTTVIAAGAWSEQLFQWFHWQPGVHPVRGQMLLLRPSRVQLTQILLAGPEYVVPRQDGLILVGSTEELVGFEKATTEPALAKLRQFAVRMVPGLDEARVEQAWAGLRPASRDHRPYLGRVPGWDNAYVATGHFRSGLQLSIITGILMRELILGWPATLDLSPFRPDRPPSPPQPRLGHAL